jgi:hypothetical protein
MTFPQKRLFHEKDFELFGTYLKKNIAGNCGKVDVSLMCSNIPQTALVATLDTYNFFNFSFITYIYFLDFLSLLSLL